MYNFKNATTLLVNCSGPNAWLRPTLWTSVITQSRGILRPTKLCPHPNEIKTLATFTLHLLCHPILLPSLLVSITMYVRTISKERYLDFSQFCWHLPSSSKGGNKPSYTGFQDLFYLLWKCLSSKRKFKYTFTTQMTLEDTALQWNKPLTKRANTVKFHLYEIARRSNSQRQKQERWSPGAAGRQEWGDYCQ